MRRVRSVQNTMDAARRLESPAFRRGEYQNRTNKLSICRIMVQSKTPVDGKRNTKGTSRKISRKEAV